MDTITGMHLDQAITLIDGALEAAKARSAAGRADAVLHGITGPWGREYAYAVGAMTAVRQLRSRAEAVERSALQAAAAHLVMASKRRVFPFDMRHQIETCDEPRHRGRACYDLHVNGARQVIHESIGVVSEVAYQLDRLEAGEGATGECGELALGIWNHLRARHMVAAYLLHAYGYQVDLSSLTMAEWRDLGEAFHERAKAAAAATSMAGHPAWW